MAGGKKRFQSTPPVKAATHNRRQPLAPARISIHAAREGGDFAVFRDRQTARNFNPRRP